MMKSFTAKSLTLSAIMTLWICSVPVSAQNPFCGSILQYGIYDSYRALDEVSQYNLAKSIHCDERVSSEQKSSGMSGSAGYGGFSGSASHSSAKAKSESSKFCASNYNQYINNESHKLAVEKINQGIVQAWSQCIKENKAGFAHYIRPSSDPKTFTYKIIYTPDGKPYEVPLTTWIADKAKCKPVLKKDSKINSSGTELICKRSEKEAVVIVADADTGTRNLRAITLSAIPPPVKVKDDITKKVFERRFLSDGNPYSSPKNIHEGLQENRVYWQDTIEMGGETFPKGLGMHPMKGPWASVEYRVPTGAKLFRTSIGMACQGNDTSTPGNFKYRVILNNSTVKNGNIVGPCSKNPKSIKVPVSGGQILRLEINSNGPNSSDHATWAEARFE